MTLDLSPIAADLAILQAGRVDDNPLPWVEASERLADVHAGALLTEVERLTTQLAAANETVARYRAALEVYADEMNWVSDDSWISDDAIVWWPGNHTGNGWDVARVALTPDGVALGAAEEGEGRG